MTLTAEAQLAEKLILKLYTTICAEYSVIILVGVRTLTESNMEEKLFLFLKILLRNEASILASMCS
jgi:hypothetical protein